MYLDLIFAGVVLVFAGFGYWRGALSQILALVSLVAAIFFARDLAARLVLELGIRTDLLLARYVLTIIVGFGIYVVGRIATIAAEKYLFKDRAGLKKSDRFIGMFLGAIKGLAFVVVLAFVGAAVLRSGFVQVKQHPELGASYAVRLLQDVDLVKRLEYVNFLRKLSERHKQLGENRSSPDNDALEALLRKTTFREAMDSNDFQRSLEDLDFDRLSSYKAMADLYEDPKIRALIMGDEGQASAGTPRKQQK